MNDDKRTGRGEEETFSNNLSHVKDAFSFTEQVREIGIYWHLANAKDENDFKRRILTVLERIGFSDFLYGTLSTQPDVSEKVIGTMETLREIYITDGYYLDDIVLHHGRKCAKPILTSTVTHYISSSPFQTKQFQRNLEWVALCKSYGYYDAYNIPFFTDEEDDAKIMLSVFSKGLKQAQFRSLITRTKTVLYLLAEAVSYIGSQKFPELLAAGGSSGNEDREVMPKPLKLLNILVKEDLSLKDAAVALSISIDTANKHMAAIKKALGANTQAAAVYLAFKKGLIECD